MAKQTTITVETDSLLILQARSSNRHWCPACNAEVEMIAMEQIGVVSNLDRPALEQWLNSAGLHRSQQPNGSTLLCMKSLLARVQNPQLPDRTAVVDAKESK